MPRPKATAESLTHGMEEDTTLPDALPTPESNQENAAPKGRGRGRGKAESNAATKPKPAQKRNHAATGVGKKKAAPKKASTKRGPLKEQSSNCNPEDTEDVDDFDEGLNERDGGQSAVSADELVAVKQPTKKAPAGVKRKNQNPKKQTDREALQHIKGTAKDGEFEYTPVTARQAKPVKKPPGKPPTNQRISVEVPASEKVIPDTQDVVMGVDLDEVPLQSEDDEEVPQSVFRQTKHARSRHPQPPLVRKRAGSASETEQGAGDPVLRRKLGEMTKKFENLDMKYKALRDVGIKEAEANFESLKLSAEGKSKGNVVPLLLIFKVTNSETAANELIASLKKELATQKALAQESRTLQKQLAAKDTEVSKAQALATELSNSLSEAQNENRILQARVTSARTTSMTIESTNAMTPGSAIKGKGPARTIMVGSAEAAQTAQAAQLKEDLYRDLTGLLVLGVERGNEADTYDCIQTGLNGTLHFKLGIATNSEENYADTEFQYTPRLDNDRDRDLLELLPDYLSEEITFSRLNAAKFYGRVVETLTKKRVENDDA
ncbi:MAG: hypothetical protein LQ345_001537 [Seirophora villosa]|nr:MAG: hypothetical protein LQ345_001537 [Seirophora villosa]